MAPPTRCSTRGLKKGFGDTSILKGIDLVVAEGSFVVLVGPSGCGKSTLLRLLAGLEEPDEGTIAIAGKDVTHAPPRDRDIAMVFQSYALYPHLTVRQNLAFGLELRREPTPTIEKRIGEASAMLGLDPLLDRLPKQLSGGQRQRVAMGRAIVRRAKLYLFDEPLSNLDAALRAEVRVQIRKLHDAIGATTVYVTHDQVEAMTLADALWVLNKGKVEQRGAPLDVYGSPATRFVATFLGSPKMNLVRGVVRGGDRVRVVGGGFDVPVPDLAAYEPLIEGHSVDFGIRPHDLRVASGDSKEASIGKVRIELVEALGFEAYAYGIAGGPGATEERIILRLTPDEARTRKAGDVVDVRLEGRLHLFDAASEISLARGGEEERRPADARMSGDHRLVLWHAYVGDEEAALTEVVARFRAAHPGTEVEVLALPLDAYTNKLTAAVPRGNGPDVFLETHDRLGVYRRDGVVAPATAILDDADAARVARTSLDAVTLDGVRYGVPMAVKSLALYTNPALVKEPPGTMEALLRLPHAPGVFPLAYPTTNAYFHAPILHAFGARMLGDHGDFAMASPGGIRSFELVRGWTRAGLVPDEPSDATIVDLFLSGRAAAVVSGPWFEAQLGEKIAYRVSPLPRLEAAGEMKPFLTVEAAMLTPTGLAHASDAKELVHFLAFGEGAVTRAVVGHQVVTDREAREAPEVLRDPRLAAFAEAADHAIPTPTSREMRATWVPAQNALLKTMRGEASAKDALLEAQHRFDDVMRPPPPAASKAPLSIAMGGLLLLGALALARQARGKEARAALLPSVRRSLPAYAYVAHSVVIVMLLVVMPLLAGAFTSLYAGAPDELRYVGLANYWQILTARGGPLLAHGSFWLTLLVTLLWTATNLAAHLGIGLVLGIVLSRPFMRLRALYRVLLILPWAVPSYVTALAWKGMFHTQFGAINAILSALGAPPVAWFSRFSTAFTANLATNVWLGFPFMMVVTMGALTSISKDVLEAAEVDGATRWQRFRLITLPLLRPALLPSVILGAVWTFNMFNVVFLVSGGEPDETTDILVSEAYRWAFERDAQYGYAAAYAVLIFLLLLFGTRLLGRVQANAVNPVSARAASAASAKGAHA